MDVPSDTILTVAIIHETAIDAVIFINIVVARRLVENINYELSWKSSRTISRLAWIKINSSFCCYQKRSMESRRYYSTA